MQQGGPAPIGLQQGHLAATPRAAFPAHSSSRRVRQQGARVVLAVGHRRRRLQVIRPRRQDARPAEPRHHPALGHDVLAAVGRRQVAPELEPADGVELRPVVEHAPGHPRDLVRHPPLPRPHVLLRQVQRVGRVVQHPAVPRRGVRRDPLRRRPPLPALERPELGRAAVVEVRHPLHRGPDEPAPELGDRLVQPGDGAGLEPDVVVEEQRVPGGRAGQQGRPVLRDAVAGRMHHGVDAVPGRPQDPQQRLRGRGVERRSPVGLVADDDVERVVLRGEPGQRRRQLDGAVAGRDQDVDPRRSSAVTAPPRRPAWRGSG